MLAAENKRYFRIRVVEVILAGVVGHLSAAHQFTGAITQSGTGANHPVATLQTFVEGCHALNSIHQIQRVGGHGKGFSIQLGLGIHQHQPAKTHGLHGACAGADIA